MVVVVAWRGVALVVVVVVLLLLVVVVLLLVVVVVVLVVVVVVVVVVVLVVLVVVVLAAVVPRVCRASVLDLGGCGFFLLELLAMGRKRAKLHKQRFRRMSFSLEAAEVEEASSFCSQRTNQTTDQ